MVGKLVGANMYFGGKMGGGDKGELGSLNTVCGVLSVSASHTEVPTVYVEDLQTL